MNVLWSARALRDLDRLHDFLAEKDTEAADRALELILEAAEAIGRYPRIGKVMADGRRREWPVAFGAGAYVLRYRLSAANALVLRVWHSREERR